MLDSRFWRTRFPPKPAAFSLEKILENDTYGVIILVIRSVIISAR